MSGTPGRVLDHLRRGTLDPSGIRIGTPALTTRGMKEKEMLLIADFIDTAIVKRTDEAALAQVRAGVQKLTDTFAIYKHL